MNYTYITLFAKNLKKLRIAHNLNGELMSKLIGMNSKGSFSKLENAKNQPSFQTLINVAKVFAVDLDWLVGRIDKPYQEELIESEERDLFPLITQMPDGYALEIVPYNQVVSIPKDYTDLNSRRQTYSLPLRANIIYLAHLLSYLIKTNPDTLDYLQYLPNILVKDSSTKNDSLMRPLFSQTPMGKRELLNHSPILYCYYSLDRLWGNEKEKPLEQQIPIFDILKNE